MTDSCGNIITAGDYVQKQPPINQKPCMLVFDQSKYQVMEVDGDFCVLCPVANDKTISVEHVYHTRKSMNNSGLVKIKE